MTNPTHTFASPFLQLQATPDESTVVAAMPSGMEKTLVTSETNPLTGGIEKLISDKMATYTPSSTPILIIGGDHPYRQWYGTNGTNGMAALYAMHGITPYMAVNTGLANSAASDPADFMTWEEIKGISGSVELLAHGHRHPQDWRLVNTGISVRYTGASGTATAQVTSTALVLVDSGTTTLLLATYTTLSALCSAVNLVPGWACTLAEELDGTEASTKLLTRAAAGAKTADLALCSGGGILITNTGTTYKRLYVGNSGTAVEIYANGVRVYSQAYAGQTLNQLVTAINALGSGITAELTNDTPANSVKYCSGLEDASNLVGGWSGRRHVGTEGIMLSAGLTHWYIVERQFKKCTKVATENGVTLVDFAQSGGGFFQHETAGHSSFELYRGNRKGGSSIAPSAFMQVNGFMPHHAISQLNYPMDASARLTALLDALIDSAGYAVNGLMHALLADGTSGFQFPTSHPAYYDQLESDWVEFLTKAAAARAAGLLRIMSPSEYKAQLGGKVGAISNYLFNPRLKNSGESLLIASSNNGLIVPGWRLGAMSAGASEVTISADGVMTILATGSTINPLQQAVNLPPGHYEWSVQILDNTYTSGEGVTLSVQSSSPDYFTKQAIDMLPNQSVFESIGAMRSVGTMSINFSVAPPRPSPAEVISLNSQPWNLSANKNIRLNINGIGATTDIDCSAGASSSSAVTAKEIAAAINTGMAAQASYAAEYHTIAKAVNGKVVITNPYIGSTRLHGITISDGSTLSATYAIFGGGCESVPLLATHDMFSGLPVTVGIVSAMVGTVKLTGFSLRRIGEFQ